MTDPEVEWVLDQLGTVIDSVATDYTLDDGSDVTVRRVDRDNTRIYDGSGAVDMSTPIRQREAQLEKGIYVGARSADPSQSPIGTEFDLDIERTVGLRVEGLTARGGQWGHVDPDGNIGVPWAELKSRIRSALYAGRTFPDTGEADVSFTHLQLTNEAPQSSDYADYYRWDCDVVFDGFEDL